MKETMLWKRIGRAASCMLMALLLCGMFAGTVLADDDSDETVYDISDFISWMLSRDDLTDEMEADLENAQEMLEGYVESEEIILDDEDDAASLTNLAKSVSILQTIDDLRQSDEYYNQLYDMTTLYTNFTMMVGSAYTANVSIYQVSHVSSYTTFASNEGLAWGYSDPTAGWYTSEKAYVTQAMEDLGYDLTDLTSSTWSAVQTQAKTYGTIGHYTGLFYGVSSGKDTLMGLGYTTERYLYGTTSSYNACYRSKYSSYEAYTIDEFESYLYEYLIEINGGSGDCSNSEDDTSSVSWAFDNTTKTLTISGSGAMADYTAKAAPWYYLAGRIENIVIEDGVTSVGAYAFYGCTGASSVTIAESVAQIGNYAFYNCIGLESLALPEGLESIGNYAFYNCTGLESLALPEGLESIGNRAFYYCSSLKEITLPDSLAEIGTYAFSRCTSLESMTLPDNLTTLGKYAFYYCTSLTSVYIPGNLSSVGEDAFYYCTSLTDVTFAEGITSIPAYLFSGCYGLTEITIPETVVSIGAYAFYDCSGLEGITIPETVTSIGAYAFCDCTSLTSITIPETVTSVGNYAFYGCTSLAETVIESSSTSVGTHLFQGCTSLTDVSLPDGTTSVKSYMFYGCTSLTQIDLPDTLTLIATYAFCNCTALESITIPESVTNVNGYAFYGCTSLTEAVMTGGVKNIYAYAFQNCTALESVTFPSTLQAIYACAFNGCSALTDVYYVGSASTWASNVTIYEENDEINDATFHYVINLSDASVTLSESSYTYDGTAKTPSVTVTCDGDTLTKGTDYTVSYADNTDAGTASVTVTGAGDCVGSVTMTFTITPASIADAEVTLKETAYTYDGSAQEAEVSSVVLSGTSLSAGSDYTVSCSNNTNAGTAYVTVTGTGNYTDSVSVTFTISAASIAGADVTLSYTSVTYSGSAHQPDVTVTLDGTTLAPGTDYTVSCSDDTNVGTAAVLVTGRGNYTGTAEASFVIEAASIADAVAVLSDTILEYNGSAQEPSVTLTLNDTVLTAGTDYTVSYSDNTQIGTATVTITGIGNYTGTLTKTFVITECLHVGSSGTVITEATCTQEGSISYTCTKCGEVYTEAIAATGHSYEASVTAPTCTESGYTTYTCSVCGDSFTDDETAATGHTAADAVQENVVNATCTETGSYDSVVYCADCGTELSRETVTLDLADHSYEGEITTEATCTEEGVITYTCSVCGDTYTDTIPATGHTYSASFSWSSDYSSATATIRCSSGDFSTTAAADVTSTVATAATCTSEGVRTYTATVTYNGTTYTDTKTASIAATGHNYSVVTSISLATGSITYTCANDSSHTKIVSGTASVTLSTSSYTYNGSARMPSVTVRVNGATLTQGTHYTVSYSNNVDAGTATVTVTGIGSYAGSSISKTFTITRASQTLTVKKSAKTVKYTSVKKKKQTVRAITKVSGAKGKVTYKRISGKSYFTVNSKTGKITVKKGTKKGTYKIKIKVTSAATSNYKKATKTVTVTIKVK